jgi:asparagine synthase (glutamine-hydrolysing)
MCGIAGYLDPSHQLSTEQQRPVAEAMINAIRYRGPDHGAVWLDTSAGVTLGYRRLAIIDTSPTGEQPFYSHDDRYVMVFNGEIYNYQSFRDELAALGYRFRGHSDTEAALAAIQEWGIEAAVKRFNGMYAFAVWDKQERALHLVRDRVGIKPLYYGWSNDVLLFGSELKALAAHPCFAPQLDHDALASYLRYGYVPAPHTIYHDIYKLSPGALITLKDGALTQPISYWSPQSAFEQGAAQPYTATSAEATDALETLLRDSVKLQMISDVPLGAFLSGGVDSSTVVALMQAQSNRPVHTFSIGFTEGAFDEAGYARAVAAHLGTQHTELYVSPDEMRAVVPQLATMFDEPFADSSQIPTYLVSKLARQHVTVSLSGDGGDELFAGYDRYRWANRLVERVGGIPKNVRQFGAGAIKWISPSLWDTAGGAIGQRRLGDKAHKLADSLAFDSPQALYRDLHSLWQQPLALNGNPYPDVFAQSLNGDYIRWMQQADVRQYMPDDILTKVDRASMATSLEARVPLLDHRVVEFAAQLPLSYLLRDGKAKWLLRQVLYRYVPASLIERPKSGFVVPLAGWLRHDLRDWAESQLDEHRLHSDGLLNPTPIRQAWTDHLSGRRNHQHALWAVLMFQAWCEQWN